MDRLSSERFRRLMEHEGEACVSIYLPTHLAGRRVTEDPIRLKDLVVRAERELAELGMRPAEARSMLAPLKALAEDPTLWRYGRSPGMAVFADPEEGAQHYRLPLAFEPLVVVGRRYHVKPLLPLFTDDARFYVLALSQGRVRLLQGTRQAVSELNVPGMPEKFEDLGKYIDAEESVQFHTNASVRGPEGGRGEQVFHTQHAGSDAAQEKAWLADFCFLVEKAVSGVLAAERAPLVLAATEPLVGLYRRANGYRGMIEEPVWGNPDRWNEHELHEKAWPRVEEVLSEVRDRAVARFEQTALAGKSTQLEPVLLAALDGRIDQLLVSSEANRWGRFDNTARRCEVHERRRLGDEDLLDRAAVLSRLNGGTVYALPQDRMPEGAVAAAIWRY